MITFAILGSRPCEGIGQATGPLEPVHADGRVIAPAAESVFLCRCGRSASKPSCDGSHARTGWTGQG
jgi:CDGSH-type Zn-finger protein